jgi:hypothetical protein
MEIKMGVADYFFAQLDAMNHDRKDSLNKLTADKAKKCQDIIIKYVLREQHQGHELNITKPSIFTLIENFTKDHVKSDSKHLDLFHESQDNVKLFFLGLANLTSTEIEH